VPVAAVNSARPNSGAPLDPPAVNGEADRAKGIFETPDSFALAAIGWNKGLVVLFAVAFALLGAVLGYLQQPTYTASATLQVGQVNPNSPGFLGYTQSAASLSTAFSRSIGAAPVLATVKRELELGRTAAASRLSAEPIPQAPVFRVIATGPNELAAIRLANVAAGAVVVYESKSNSANPQAKSLLRDYREASLDLRRSVMQVAEAEGESSDELQAEAAKSAAQIKLDAIGKAYTGAVTSQAPRQGLVSLLAGATSASSNRRSNVEMYGFIGLLIGLALGCGAAMLRERRLAATAPEPSPGLQPRPRSSQPA
jgi:capsular polysaccharide biosynthesis protein